MFSTALSAASVRKQKKIKALKALMFFFAQAVNVLRHEVITVYLHCCLAE